MLQKELKNQDPDFQRYLRGQTHFEIEDPLNVFKDPSPKSLQGFLTFTLLPLYNKAGGKPSKKAVPDSCHPVVLGSLEVS